MKARLSCGVLVPLTLIILAVRIEFFQVKRRAAIIVHYCNFPEKTHFTISVCTGGGECALKRAQRGQERQGDTWQIVCLCHSIVSLITGLAKKKYFHVYQVYQAIRFIPSILSFGRHHLERIFVRFD